MSKNSAQLHATYLGGPTVNTENNSSLLEAFSILGIKDRLQILEPGVVTALSLD
ncbi:MAG TPA: hypothetical protein VGE90_10405 [Chitinophaga sp.]